MKPIALAKRAPVVVIAAAVLLAYWPLSTFGYTLPHGDTLDCWLPWRYFIAACLHDGSLPLWNPLQQMGYPVHADLQGPAWSLEALALAGTIGQGLGVLQALFLAYVVLGGWGMLRLVRTVHGHGAAALLMGLAYALGGFFTGHTMHFYSVISAAWLPWVVEAQIRLMRAPHWRPALAAAVYQAFQLTSGNHTFTILAAYLIAALWTVHVVRALGRDRAKVRGLVLWEAVSVLAMAVMACGTLWSAAEVIPRMTRGEGLSLDAAASGSFTLRAFISLLTPFATGTDKVVLGTDPTMANGYMGALVLAWAALALFRRRTLVENVLLGAGVVSALAAMGPALPVHRLLWAVLPGMDLFRFPSYFLLATQLAMLVLAGGTLARWPEVMARRATVLSVLGALLAVAGALVARAMVDAHGDGVEATLYDRLRAMGTAQRILLNGAVLLPVLAAAVWWVFRRRTGMAGWGALLLVEMIWSTGLAAFNTSVADLSPGAVQARINAFTPLPIVPPLTPMGEARDDAMDLQVLWRNTQNYKGHPSFGGFNSFQLRSTAHLIEAEPRSYQALLKHPLIHLGDTLDARSPVPGHVELIHMDNHAIGAMTRSPVPAMLHVQQAWYPGWRAWVDGVEVPVERIQEVSFATRVPAGEHRVRFAYERPILSLLYFLSLGAQVLVLLVLAWTGSERSWWTAGVVVLACVLGYSLLAHRSKADQVREGLVATALGADLPDLVVTDRPLLVRELLPAAATLRIERAIDLPLLVKAVEAVGRDRVAVATAGLALPPEALPLLDDQGWHHQALTVHAGVELHRFVRQLPGGEGEVIHLDPLDGGRLLHAPGAPYTAAFRRRVGDMGHLPGERIGIDLRFRAGRGARAYVVIERKRGDAVVDYEAVPFTQNATADTAWSAFLVLRDRRELRDPDAELGIYLWCDSPDTVEVKDLRIRMMGGKRVKEGG